MMKILIMHQRKTQIGKGNYQVRKSTKAVKEIVNTQIGRQFLFADNICNKYISVVILLFAGMRREDFFIDVVHDSEYLLYLVRWYEAMRNPKKIARAEFVRPS